MEVTNDGIEVTNDGMEVANNGMGVANNGIGVTNDSMLIDIFYYLYTDINQKTTDIMLIYNFQRVFKARGIDKPFSFLVNHGISHSVATRMTNNKTDKIFLKYLEKACLILNCTPDDIIEWVPGSKKQDNEDTALHALKKEQKGKGAEELLRGLPMSKLEALAKLLREGKD